MNFLKVLTRPEQVAGYMRGEILRGTWHREMPGAPLLAAELGIDHKTVIAAFRLLEDEGLLATQGAGRRRKILHQENHAPPTLRVQILLHGEDDGKNFWIVDLQHQLLEMGYVARFEARTLLEMGMDVKRIARLVEKSEADAWVICSGSREILEWFAQQPTPAFALAGRRRGIPIAGSGPDKVPALRDAVRRLVALGHRRIVMLSHEERRKPHPGHFERSFLAELEAHGIPTGPYNLPDWQDNITDFHRCLDALFQHTPPTAVLIDQMALFISAERHLAQLGILAPRDVSLICQDPDPAFAWCQPTVAHIHWDPRPLVRRIVDWADHVARGKMDRRQSFTKARFVEGGTIGQARQAR